MSPVKALKTSDIARILDVHPNTVRYYETLGYLPPIRRADNGYRQYHLFHVEQAKLIRLTLKWPYAGDHDRLIELVKTAAKADFGMAMELAYQHLAHLRVERTYAEAALEFLERWVSGYLIDTTPQKMYTKQASDYLQVSVDRLRNWERNGLIDIPRDPVNGYRLYGAVEFGRLRVIRMLLQSGYSLMAILRMFQQVEGGQAQDLRQALEVPLEDSANEAIEVIADRWLSSLMKLEQDAHLIIQQLSRMIELRLTSSL